MKFNLRISASLDLIKVVKRNKIMTHVGLNIDLEFETKRERDSSLDHCLRRRFAYGPKAYQQLDYELDYHELFPLRKIYFLFFIQMFDNKLYILR